MALIRSDVTDQMVWLLSGDFYPALLIQADWPGGVVRVHSGTGTMSWSGQSWQGAGHLVGFSADAETAGLALVDASLSVAQTIEAMLESRTAIIRNRQVEVWFAATTTAGGAVLAADPFQLFSGYFDGREFTLSRDGEAHSHDMTLFLAGGPGPRSKVRITHTPESQAVAHPGDTIFRQVLSARKRQINPQQWPAP